MLGVIIRCTRARASGTMWHWRTYVWWIAHSSRLIILQRSFYLSFASPPRCLPLRALDVFKADRLLPLEEADNKLTVGLTLTLPPRDLWYELNSSYIDRMFNLYRREYMYIQPLAPSLPLPLSLPLLPQLMQPLLLLLPPLLVPSLLLPPLPPLLLLAAAVDIINYYPLRPPPPMLLLQTASGR